MQGMQAAACRALGGTPGSRGDVSLRIPVFEFFPTELRFWEADEEFPAQLQFSGTETPWTSPITRPSGICPAP